MQTLHEHHFYVKFNKCEFFQDKIYNLGNVISKEGIAVDPKIVKVIMDSLVPKDAMIIISFMGIMGYYNICIEGFLKLAYLITSLGKE